MEEVTWPRCPVCEKVLSSAEYSIAFEGMYYCLKCAEANSSRGKVVESNVVRIRPGDIVRVQDGKDSIILEVGEDLSDKEEEIKETPKMKQQRLAAASFDRILRGEGLTHSNAERFSKENYWREREDDSR